MSDNKKDNPKSKLQGVAKTLVNLKPMLKKAGEAAADRTPAASTLTPHSSDKAISSTVVERVLNITQRRQRANQMRRYAKKLERLRNVAKNQLAPDVRLKKRSGRLARSLVRARFAGKRGEKYQKLSPSDKIAIDSLIKNKVKLIKRLAKRLMPVIRKAEMIRLQGVRTHNVTKSSLKKGNLGIMPKPSLVRKEDVVTDTLALCLMEGQDKKIEQLLKAGLADQDEIQKYRKALADPETAKRYTVLRDKVFEMLDKLLNSITKDASVFMKVKKDMNENLKEEQERAREVVSMVIESLKYIKNPSKHPSHTAAANNAKRFKEAAAKIKPMKKKIKKAAPKKDMKNVKPKSAAPKKKPEQEQNKAKPTRARGAMRIIVQHGSRKASVHVG